MENTLKRKFCATAIGSVPHTDAKSVCEKILSYYKDVPFWPQMPKRSFFENMYAQFMEGFPCAVIDGNKKRVWVDASNDLLGALEKAYQKLLEEDFGYFAVTESAAAGFYEFLSQAGKKDLRAASYLKGQITGPVSLGLTVTDEKKQPILYNSELSEALVKILSFKARWQIKQLKKIFDGIIIFIDEPYLVSIGSSVVNIKKDDATVKIKELISAIHQEGALAGMHCCGNTDWSLLLGLGLDILNFDAYNYMESLSLYPEPLERFLAEKGILAWGITPTSDSLKEESGGTLVKKLEEGIARLTKKGIEKDAILDSLMVTPSCGCGTMSVGDAERVLGLNIEVSESLSKIYGR